MPEKFSILVKLCTTTLSTLTLNRSCLATVQYLWIMIFALSPPPQIKELFNNFETLEGSLGLLYPSTKSKNHVIYFEI